MATAKAPSVEEQDAADARELVRAAARAIQALQSLRSRMVGKRDATAATGHVLAALDAEGGALREYDRPHVFALRHALGGESFAVASLHDAAAQVLGTIVQAMRPPRDENEEARRKNARGDMMALAKIFRACDHAIQATKNIEQHDAGVVLTKAAADKAAHDARLAAGGRTMHASSAPARADASSTRPRAPKPAGKDAAPDGDYAIDGSVDAPGGNPFPTAPVG
jgi:hypothetical protein